MHPALQGMAAWLADINSPEAVFKKQVSFWSSRIKVYKRRATVGQQGMQLGGPARPLPPPVARTSAQSPQD